jgi:hypothetical protein
LQPPGPEGQQLLPKARGLPPLSSAGPDAYGYNWDDAEPFGWIDATVGTDIGLEGDDRYSEALDIGFDFKFYENTYSEVYVSTNGLVTLGSGASQYANHPIPSPATPNDYLSPFWDDLCVNYGGYNSGSVYVLQSGSAPSRAFTIEWHEVSRLWEYDLLTFQVVLHENGDIVMQYLSLDGELESATVGIEDDLGVDGLQYLYNAPGLIDNLAVRPR